MAVNIDYRLNQLRARRDGRRGMPVETVDSATYADSLAARLFPAPEPWEKRGSAGQRHTRYAIGAMQAVSETYTKVSIDTANRVADQLRTRLPKTGFSVDFRLQGSVPLDVHIKGASDVDLLVLDTVFLTYRTAGARALSGGYGSAGTRNSVQVLSSLRAQIETDLPLAYPAATVDTSGAKAVKLSGASLARDVDVVPAHWLDTIEYQASGREIDRGVEILDAKKRISIENLPFLHIDRIRARCIDVGGGLRKSIRLCKNVKADSDRKITLPSFDIAATMYHANMDALRRGQYIELAILAETQRHLDFLACNPQHAKTLRVPDNSRLIFDTDEKLQGLLQLSLEMDDLLSNVYGENAPGLLDRVMPMNEKRAAVSAVAA
jgi:hypothetical protein